MPELPEVEAVCRRIRPGVRGQAIQSARFLRPSIAKPQDARAMEETLAGRRIEQVSRRGKNILIHISGELVLHVHLRMTGNLHVVPSGEDIPASARFVVELESGKSLLYTDSRAIGRIHLHTAQEVETLLGDLGPEPLSRAFTAQRFADSARASAQPAKTFLMDQRHVAGLGNIYAAEALFEARIHPARKMKSLRRPRLDALHAAITGILRKAVKLAAAEYQRPGYWGEEEWDFPLQVYDREGQPCLVCGTQIRRITQGGRSTYFCPRCQR